MEEKNTKEGVTCNKDRAKELARMSFIQGEKNGMARARAIYNHENLPYFNWATFERSLDQFLDDKNYE
jgi:hypothetical protein